MDILNQSIRRRKTIEDSHLLEPSPSPQPNPNAVHLFARTPSPQDFDSPASTPTPLVRSRPLSPLLPPNTPSKHRIHFPRSSKPWLSSIIIQLSIVLWLVPIAILLWLNLSSYRVGAALWCPGGKCTFNPFSEKSHKQANDWNKEARNLIGILQLVAKALEVWFVAIASGFIFSITSFLVVRKTGLPLSLFLASVEFSDIRILSDKGFWLSARPPRRGHMPGSASRDRRIYAFVGLLALLCIVTNLMGPAVAVLCVPRLQRGYTETIRENVFVSMTSDRAPHEDRKLWPDCNEEELGKGNYTCTRKEHASVFDAWFAITEEGDFQSSSSSSIPTPTPTQSSGGAMGPAGSPKPDATSQPSPGSPTTNVASPPSSSSSSSSSSHAVAFNPRLFEVAQEEHISFVFNGTLGGAGTLWAPNRRILRSISQDFERFHALTNDGRPLDTQFGLMESDGTASASASALPSSGTPSARTSKESAELSSSLQTVLNRRGPAVGANVSFYHFEDFHWIDIENEKKILCMQGYEIVNVNRTKGHKCLTTGLDWEGGINLSEAFDHWITVGNETSSASSLNVGMIFAPQARYFNMSEPPNWDDRQDWRDCFSSYRSDCDYASQMLKPANGPANITGPLSNVYTILFSMNQNGSSVDPNSPKFVAIEFNPAFAMVKYSLDTSPFTNNVRLVQLDDMPPVLHDEVAKPIHIHHSWLPALLSAVRVGKGYSAGVSNSLNSVLNNLRIIREGDSNAEGFLVKRDIRGHALHERGTIPYEHYARFFHAAHLLPLHLMSMLPFNTTDLTSSIADDHPDLLSRNATIEVWMYGLDSRTSNMGVTVVVIGSLVALVYFCLNLWKAVEVRSPTSLLASALVHEPEKDELIDIGNDEEGVGRFRYRSDLRNGGWVKFEKVY